MCDGKRSSKRDVVILSIKPKRPEYPSGQKFVPVSELLQEWDKLDAYYRGQLLKLTKSLSKSSSNKHQHSKHSHHSITTNDPSNNSSSQTKANKLHKSSYPVNKKHSSSLSSDQFTELFGDENLFNQNVAPPSDTNNNHHHHSRHHHHKQSNKLLHSRSLNSLFDDDDEEDLNELSHPPGNTYHHGSGSRKSSLSGVNNLVVSIPVLSVKHNGDTYRSRRYKYASDDDESFASESEEDEPVEDNFLSVPRDNFKVQYGTRQKTRVALLEDYEVSPKWIVPIHVAPYKPPVAQGLNGVQIQKILYHKNDSVNNASPTTTTARTPDKPAAENSSSNHSSPMLSKSTTKANSDSPNSTVSPRSTSSSSGSSKHSSPPAENNNATPKQVSSPQLSPPPKLDQGNAKPSPTSTKLSPPINSTSGMKLKRPGTLDIYSKYSGHGKKFRRVGETSSSNNNTSPNGFNSMPVTSTSSYSHSSSSSSSSSCGDNDYQVDEDLSPRANTIDMSRVETQISPRKLNVIKKPSPFLKPAPPAGADQPGTSVFIPPAAVSITERIIKKASRPQPELLERQRRRKLESNQRKSYAMQKGDEHEERESIDLSMKSFEMIWNVPLLSPLRSP